MSYSSDLVDGFRQTGGYRENPRWLQTGGSPDPAGEQVYFGGQSQDCKRARHYRAPTLLSLADEVIE
jgi:hypothetical protein